MRVCKCMCVYTRKKSACVIVHTVCVFYIVDKLQTIYCTHVSIYRSHN